tara:strand:+ start:356 stop:601 length:246 start_codon:yes stop_codon:yes gene_type:complete
MKTIKKGKKVERRDDTTAEIMVKELGWKYCPKSEWKEGQKNLEKLFNVKKKGQQCDAKYVENPKANTLRNKVLTKNKKTGK